MSKICLYKIFKNVYTDFKFSKSTHMICTIKQIIKILLKVLPIVLQHKFLGTLMLLKDYVNQLIIRAPNFL